jgi:hypothetical protein
MAGSTFLCLLAAALYWACSAIQITQMAGEAPQWKQFNKAEYLLLRSDSIEIEWFRRLDARALEYSAGFLKGAFWIVFSLPMIQMAWVLSRNGTRSVGCNFGIMFTVLGGAWSKWFTAIFWNGIYISFVQLTKNFNLANWLDGVDAARQFGLDDEDGLGWKVLEVNYVVTRGLVFVVNAVEWFFLAVIFFLTFFSVREWRKEDVSTFGGKWNSLGLFIGVLAAIDFILEVVALEWKPIIWIFFILYSALIRLILIPLWIIILGFQLPGATEINFDAVVLADAGELELLEETQQKDRPPSFTIDDDDFQDALAPPVGPSSPPAEAFNAVNL